MNVLIVLFSAIDDDDDDDAMHDTESASNKEMESEDSWSFNSKSDNPLLAPLSLCTAMPCQYCHFIAISTQPCTYTIISCQPYRPENFNFKIRHNNSTYLKNLPGSALYGFAVHSKETAILSPPYYIFCKVTVLLLFCLFLQQNILFSPGK